MSFRTCNSVVTKQSNSVSSIPGMSYYSNRLYWLSSEGLVTLLTTRSRHYTVTKLPSDGDITAFRMVYIPPELRFLKGTLNFTQPDDKLLFMMCKIHLGPDTEFCTFYSRTVAQFYVYIHLSNVTKVPKRINCSS